MPFKKGESGNPEGRRKGSKNKFTTLKDEFLKAFYDEDGISGAEGIKELLRNSPRNKMAYLQMIAKMLPTSLVGEQDDKGEFKPLKVIITNDGNKPDNPT